MRRLAPILLLALLLTGCGISQKTKDGTAAVFGYEGILDKYLAVSQTVTENQIVLMTAIMVQQGEDFELPVTRADGQTALIPIKDWIAALNKLRALPGQIQKAAHAVNDAVQADKGFSAFTEQLFRTLKGDKVLDWFIGGGSE